LVKNIFLETIKYTSPDLDPDPDPDPDPAVKIPHPDPTLTPGFFGERDGVL
jgi:hypothetical protein